MRALTMLKVEPVEPVEAVTYAAPGYPACSIRSRPPGITSKVSGPFAVATPAPADATPSLITEGAFRPRAVTSTAERDRQAAGRRPVTWRVCR
jgi:hypothetical protein